MRFWFILLLGLSQLAAHTRNHSYSKLFLDQQPAALEFRISAANIRQTFSETQLQAELVKHIQLQRGGKTCTATAPQKQAANREFFVYRITFSCESTGHYTYQYAALMTKVPSHVHFANIVEPTGVEHTLVFTRNQGEHQLGKTDSNAGSSQFFTVGLEHILGGIDHLAFVLSLLLLGLSRKNLLLTITGFTLGHSLSLLMATFDVIQMKIPIIEAFIGLSIAVVALKPAVSQNRLLSHYTIGLILLAALFSLPDRSDYALAIFGMALFSYGYFENRQLDESALGHVVITTAFGFIHGFGFASFLGDFISRQAKVWQPLLFFNFGIEVGQLVFILVLFTAYRILRLHRLNENYRVILGALLVCLGTFWFISRTFT